MPDKETKKCGAQKQAAGQSQSPASDKETPSPDKNESDDVQTGPAASALEPPKEEKQAESTLTEESKEDAAASEMQHTLAEIKPELPVFDGALALGKEHEIEKANTTEGDSSLALLTSEDLTAKSADKEEKASATAEPVVDVELEDGKELNPSLGEAVDAQAGLPSDATHAAAGSRKAGSDAEDNKDRPSKRFRSAQDIDVRLLLPHKALNFIIGSGGDNIEQLKSDYKVEAWVPDNRGPEGVLIINGDKDAVCQTLMDIIPSSKLMSPVQAHNHEIRLLVPHGLVALFMNNGQTRLQNLRQVTGCQVKVFVDNAPFSFERVVEMTGNVLEIVDCISALHKAMAELPRKDAVILYNAKNYDWLNVTGYGGYSDEHGHKDQGDSRARNVKRLKMSQVFLPQKVVGAVLGTAGCRFKQVQSESGAKMVLNYAGEGASERIISISGTEAQIQYAQYLLQIVLRRHAETAP